MAQLRRAHLNPPGRGADQRLREALRAGAAGDPEAALAGIRELVRAGAYLVPRDAQIVDPATGWPVMADLVNMHRIGVLRLLGWAGWTEAAALLRSLPTDDPRYPVRHEASRKRVARWSQLPDELRIGDAPPYPSLAIEREDPARYEAMRRAYDDWQDRRAHAMRHAVPAKPLTGASIGSKTAQEIGPRFMKAAAYAALSLVAQYYHQRMGFDPMAVLLAEDEGEYDLLRFGPRPETVIWHMQYGDASRRAQTHQDQALVVAARGFGEAHFWKRIPGQRDRIAREAATVVDNVRMALTHLCLHEGNAGDRACKAHALKLVKAAIRRGVAVAVAQELVGA